MKPAAADWFHNAVVSGVQFLMSLHLDGRPAAEVVVLTAMGWVEVLWRARSTWDEARDAQPIESAFFSLARTIDRWPAPKQLLDLVPRPDEVPALDFRPVPTAQQRADLAALQRRLADQIRVNNTQRANAMSRGNVNCNSHIASDQTGMLSAAQSHATDVCGAGQM